MAIRTQNVTRRPPQVRQSFQLWTWLFMRLSGVVLLFLALGHLAIQHIFNDVGDLSFEVVAQRWSGGFWRTWDWLLLVLALLHGTNGARTMIHDYIRKPRRRIVALAVLYTAFLMTIALGSIAIFTFNPDAFG
ncbi:MAG TPA: succinate dehydrogenase hydrophobic membrane anchor subunit [Actinomycetota bacterium]|nr:succinate dehydrogenase hydrophobic membrane anchor subunit [Actinomycetota bacterium]